MACGHIYCLQCLYLSCHGLERVQLQVRSWEDLAGQIVEALSGASVNQRHAGFCAEVDLPTCTVRLFSRPQAELLLTRCRMALLVNGIAFALASDPPASWDAEHRSRRRELEGNPSQRFHAEIRMVSPLQSPRLCYWTRSLSDILGWVFLRLLTGSIHVQGKQLPWLRLDLSFEDSDETQ